MEKKRDGIMFRGIGTHPRRQKLKKDCETVCFGVQSDMRGCVGACPVLAFVTPGVPRGQERILFLSCAPSFHTLIPPLFYTLSAGPLPLF